MELRRIYVNNFKKKQDLIYLDSTASRRIIKVLRLKKGDLLKIFWNSHNDYIAEVNKIENNLVVAKIKETIQKELENEEVSIAQCILKSNRMNWLVEKITEIGIKELIPVISQHCIYQSEKSNESKLLKWEKIMISAIEQSGRCKLPALHPIKTFKKAIVDFSKEYDIILFSNKADKALDIYDEKVKNKIQKGNIMLFIGPEGGFSDEELYFSQQHNALIVNIPKIILRAETAAIVALSITKFIRNFS
jgi:16S rRNA (uracil1498-N3)-methyltransferase